jgi:hypothetical protein
MRTQLIVTRTSNVIGKVLGFCTARQGRGLVRKPSDPRKSCAAEKRAWCLSTFHQRLGDAQVKAERQDAGRNDFWVYKSLISALEIDGQVRSLRVAVQLFCSKKAHPPSPLLRQDTVLCKLTGVAEQVVRLFRLHLLPGGHISPLIGMLARAACGVRKGVLVWVLGNSDGPDQVVQGERDVLAGGGLQLGRLGGPLDGHGRGEVRHCQA